MNKQVKTLNRLNERMLAKLVAQEKPYQKIDGAGLTIQIQPDGNKRWHLRYKIDSPETIILGKYPDYSLEDARKWRKDCLTLVKLGLSPKALKQGHIAINELSVELKQLANTFLNQWCIKKGTSVIINKTKSAKTPSAIELFAQELDTQAAERNKRPLHKLSDESNTSSKETTLIVEETVTKNGSVLKKLFGFIYKKS